MRVENRRAPNGRWWALLVAILTVLVTLLVAIIAVGPGHLLGHGTQFPAPPTASGTETGGRASPSLPPVLSPEPSPGQRGSVDPALVSRDLPGVGAEVVYTQSATEISRIDLRTGDLRRVSISDSTQYSNFLAGDDWAIWKAIDTGSAQAAGVQVTKGNRRVPLPVQFGAPGLLYLADSRHVWWLPDRIPGGGSNYSKALLVSMSGRASVKRQIHIAKAADGLVADPAGHLLTTERDGTYQLGIQGQTRIAEGNLVAVGRNQLIVWKCDRSGRCGLDEIARSNRGRRRLHAAGASLKSDCGANNLSRPLAGWNLISPNGKRLLVNCNDRNGPTRLRVLDLDSGAQTALPGALTNVNDNAQYMWTSNSRWLLAVTDGKLRAFDSRSGITRTLRGPQTPILHLAVAGQPGN